MSEENTQEAQEQAEPVAEQPTGDAYEALRRDVEAALEANSSREEIEKAVQKSFGEFAGVVRSKLDAKHPPNVEQMVQETVAKSMAPYAEKLDLVLAKLNQAPAPAQPVQKSIQYQHPAEVLSPQPVKKSIRDIARASTGLPS